MRDISNAELEKNDEYTKANKVLSAEQLKQIEELKKCDYCTDISDLEIEFPDEPHHGGIRACGECGAEYYEEWGGTIWAQNEQAKINHPSLKMI